MTDASAAPRRRLLYVVSEDFAFLLNRLPMARAAREAGFEVHVATNVDKGAEAIEAEGFTLHRIPFRRGGLSPFAAIPTVLALRAAGSVNVGRSSRWTTRCSILSSTSTCAR